MSQSRSQSRDHSIARRLDAVVNEYGEGRLPRRDFLRWIATAGAAVGLVGGPFGLGGRASAAQSIRFDGWGGAVSEAFRDYAFLPFSIETGVEVEEGEFGNMDAYLDKVKKSFPPGGTYNLAQLTGLFDYARYVGLGYDSVLDESKITRLGTVMAPLIAPYREISAGGLSAVPYNIGQTGIAYNTKRIKPEQAEELGASLLWDEKLVKGKLGAWGDWRTNIWLAALHTGQCPNNIDTMELVWSALKEQKKLVKKYWHSGAEFEELMRKGTIHASTAWSGRVAKLQQAGEPIGWLAPRNTFTWQQCIFVLRGTDMDLACKLLDWMLTPAAAIAVAEAQLYPPSLDPTQVELTEVVKKLPAFDPTGKLEGCLFPDPVYWFSNQLDWAEHWKKIMDGKA